MSLYLKRANWLFLLLVLTVLSASPSVPGYAQEGCAGCDLAREAIDAANEIKAGMKRGDLEKQFDPDGGISVQSRGTYVYRKCRFMKIDVEFEAHAVPNTALSFPPDDRIVKISTPYIAYPVSD